MYQVLLVDDEPLILSGIKFMIDWSKNGCTVVDTARNGQQALEKIKTLNPDIVICDIAMPVLSGTEVLQQAAESYPNTVFIMLTNHPDFHLAQHSLRYRAVDYLLKSDLDTATLEQSLTHAKTECNSRRKIARVDLVDDYLESNRKNLLETAFLTAVQAQPGAGAPSAAVLAENGVLNHYAVAYLFLQFEKVPDYKDFDADARARLFNWVREVCEKTAANIFPAFTLLSPDPAAESTTCFLLCWDLPQGEWEQRLQRYAEKAISACATITQVSLRVMATDAFDGEPALETCREQMFALRDHYYLADSEALFYNELPDIEWGRLALTGLGDRLAAELRAKNATACGLLLDKAIERVRTIPHQQSQALWLCGEVYGVLSQQGIAGVGSRQAIERLTTRTQVLHWLEKVKNELVDSLGQNAPAGRSMLIEKARQYVQDNVEKRIMLQDAADHICISPGYLSALFKKQYNQNFVDYINEVKTKRACELICEGRYRIYEISYMLGFENAYYFTRVFKRHTGLTPTEYQKRHRADTEKSN